MKKLLLPLVLGALALGCSNNGSSSASGGTDANGGKGGRDVKIGYLVKSATEVWFQTEHKFAEEAAKKDGFTLLFQATPDADKVLNSLDNLAAQGAQGVIICSPDVKLGASIKRKCEELNMKLMSVDDRLVGADGQPLTDIHHLGISATKIGNMVGDAINAEMKARGWNPSEVGALVLSQEELETSRERVDGATEILTQNGFDKNRIWHAGWKQYDIPGAHDAADVVLTQHPEVKKWVIYSLNDDGVLGGVRATEDHNIPAENVIGVGINGTSGVDDLKKDKPTGFFASVLLSARTHAFDTCHAMYEWITKNKEPEKEHYTTGVLITRKDFKEKMQAEGLTP